MRTNRRDDAQQLLVDLETRTRHALAGPARSLTSQVADVLDLIEAALSVGVYRRELVATLNAAGMTIALPTLETALKRARRRSREERSARAAMVAAPAPAPEPAAAARNAEGTANAEGQAAPSLEEIRRDSPHLTTTEARRARAESIFNDAKPEPSFMERFNPRR
ncbi:hypothetical protein AB4Y38_35430 [Paraburkholderia sp. EG285A]|uniref:hypothetical protein n=1 Tax=Paraburkholderia sp. EG285A TaxID=3237009 RepID=UPI0034D1E948